MRVVLRWAPWILLGALLVTPPVTPSENSGGHPDADDVRKLLAEDRWVEALERARAGHAASPKDVELAAALGESLFRAGELQEAEALLASLLEAFPASSQAGKPPPARALTTLARLRAAQGRRELSAELMLRALAIAPDDPEVVYWAGDLEGDRGRAIELLERYLSLSDEDDPDRIESAQGAVRFMKELGDRRVWIAEASPPRVELPLTQLWDATGRTTGYVVEVRMGGSAGGGKGDQQAKGRRGKRAAKGKPVRLLLDTGTSGVFLIDRIAKKRGFEPLSTKTLFGGGGDRRQATRRGVISRLDIGGLQYADGLVTTTRQELDPTGRFHGLLGISMFSGYRVTLDLLGKRLLLEQIPEEADADPKGDPYWWLSGQLLTRAAAGDRGGLFVVDTGASDTVLADGLLERLRGEQGPGGAPVTVQAIGGAVGGAKVVRGFGDAGIRFQGLRTGDAVLAFDLSLQSRLAGVEVGGLLGLDLLAKQRIVIDTRAQRIAVE